MQNRITKLKICPECKSACDGKTCRCGWEKVKGRRALSPKRNCIICNSAGYSGGLCKMHFDLQAEQSYKRRMKEYAKANPQFTKEAELFCMTPNQISDMMGYKKAKQEEVSDN